MFLGSFNVWWTKAILLTAQELNSPVILGVSEGAGKYMTGYKTVVGMVNGMMEELNITVPVALHLDHGSYEASMTIFAGVMNMPVRKKFGGSVSWPRQMDSSVSSRMVTIQ